MNLNGNGGGPTACGATTACTTDGGGLAGSGGGGGCQPRGAEGARPSPSASPVDNATNEVDADVGIALGGIAADFGGRYRAFGETINSLVG